MTTNIRTSEDFSMNQLYKVTLIYSCLKTKNQIDHRAIRKKMSRISSECGKLYRSCLHVTTSGNCKTNQNSNRGKV